MFSGAPDAMDKTNIVRKSMTMTPSGRGILRLLGVSLLLLVAQAETRMPPPLDSCFAGAGAATLASLWRGCGCDRRPPRATRIPFALEAGRARRVSAFGSGSGSDKKNKKKNNRGDGGRGTPAEQSLVEKEASARRKRLGQMEQRLRKAVGREDRIAVLQEKPLGSDAERAELEGLLRARENHEEQYDAAGFTEEHLRFKARHNDVFAQLIRYCDRRAGETTPPAEEGADDATAKASVPPTDSAATAATARKIFFLDGPDGGTASALVRKWGVFADRCCVANRHASTCAALAQNPSLGLPASNIAHATASEALTRDGGAFAHLHFCGYYFDGCNGHTPHIVNMLSAALLVLDEDNEKDEAGEPRRPTHQHPIAVGYSLLGDPRRAVEKELSVSRALTAIARSRGSRVVHALEDPVRFGLEDPTVPKVCGKTFTTWLVLEP